MESEGVRWQEKVQNLEREKADAVLSLKKKIDSMEVSRTNEISRLQAVHRSEPWTSLASGHSEIKRLDSEHQDLEHSDTNYNVESCLLRHLTMCVSKSSMMPWPLAFIERCPYFRG